MAAAALISCPEAARAQGADPSGGLTAPLDVPPDTEPFDLPPDTEALDPSAPLAPLPDLGIDWPDMAQDPGEEIADTPDTSIADAATERKYTFSIEGLGGTDTEGLLAEFRTLSTLEANKGDPANAAQIDRRAREDAALLDELLRSFGYYDALVETRVEAAEPGAPARVILTVEPGPLYHFAEVSLPGLDEAGDDAAALRTAFGVEVGQPVKAAQVTAGQAALAVELGRRGFAFAEVGDLDVAVDHDTRTAKLTLSVMPNGIRQFGQIRVEGTPLFSERHLQTIARFRQGQQYNAALLEDLRRALIQTGLISSAVIRPVENGETKQVDVAVALEPGPMRTIAGAAGYGTGEGYRIEASWQHRNLLPPEGGVTVRGILGTREQLGAVTLRRNNFRRRDQVLNANIAVGNIDRDAYDARTFQIGANIERQTNIIWQKTWTWSLGVELIASDERDVDLDTGMERRRTFIIGALPGTLSYDGSNDLLDPTEGFRLSGRFSPELSFQDSIFAYGRLQLDGSYYYPATKKVTVAGRVRLGTIVGASRDRIAPSRRFYAGGGGSVRGYGYQDLGPRDPVFDDPIGGRSLAEFSLEARVRIGNFGIVPFIDAGNIYESELPDIGDLRFGAGIGVRYHTRFGPIRVDLGTPLNPQSGDPKVAVYVSLGQAF